METFDKKSLTAEEQIDLLKTRGLIINDQTAAVQTIQRIGYYHLSSYMRNFQFGESHQFYANTEFAEIIDLYNFDRDLRHITFKAIEQIEIVYRTAISNIMCKKFGSHWFYNESVFSAKTIINEQGKVETQQEQIFKLIQSEIKKKKKKDNEYAETFIRKYYDKYFEPQLPPFWMIIETFSIGSLHRVYYSLKDIYKKEITTYLGFDKDSTFIALSSNWLQPICMVRNICAHHSRLFNRKFRIKTKQHKFIKEFAQTPNDCFYYIAMVINYYLKTISNDFSFEKELIDLFNKYPKIDKTKLNFPNKWTHFEITRIAKHQKNIFIKSNSKTYS